MISRIFLLIIFTVATGCSVLQQADDRRAAERACGVELMKEPNLKQLYCMEEKGKDMPNYESLAHKIEQLKKEENSDFENNVDLCKVIKTDQNGSIYSGVIEAPRTHPIPFVKEQARRHCEKQNRSKFRIVNIEVVKKTEAVATEVKSGTEKTDPPKPSEVYVQNANFECS